MLRILRAGRPLSLLPGTTLSLEYNNPLFDEENVLSGTFCYSFSLPLDDTNRAEFGYPEIIENYADLRRRYEDYDIEYEGYLIAQAGVLVVRKVNAKRLDVAVGFGMSRFAPELEKRKIHSFELGGERVIAALVTPDYGFLPISGLVEHANQTVLNFEAHDYVFAPLRNHFSEEDPPVPTLLNPWSFQDMVPFGAPMGGTFLAPPVSIVPGQVPPPGPPILMAPQPKLTYVLESIIRELGVLRTRLEWPAELQRLVLLSAVSISNRFRVADSLPDLSVKDLLLALRADLGSVPLFAVDGSLRHVLLSDVLASPEYDDWTKLAAPAYIDRELPDVQGRTLTYNVNSDDTVAVDYFRPPSALLPRGEPVATRSELPATQSPDRDLLPPPELRLVIDEQAFYVSAAEINFVLLQYQLVWTRHSSALEPVKIAGGGPEQAQVCTATATEVISLAVLNTQQREEGPVPAITEEPFVPTDETSERSANLRLAFFRGLQPSSIDPNHQYAASEPDYPLLTPFRSNALGAAVGSYSLRVDGPEGTAAQLLGQWLEMVATATPVKRTVYLTPEQLATLDFTRKKRIDGNLYLVKHVAVQLPLQKGATVTLIPLPRG